MTFLLVLLLQVPELEEVSSIKLEEDYGRLLCVSSTGKFLVFGHREAVLVCDAATAKILKNIPAPWTTAGFEDQDGHLLVVGKDLARYDPSGWKEISREPLVKAEFLEPAVKIDAGSALWPRQAWIAPDGSVLYRAMGGDGRRATRREGKLISEVVGESVLSPDSAIVGFLGSCPATPFALVAGGRVGVMPHKTVTYLIASDGALFAGVCRGVLVVVAEHAEGVYDPGNWKIQKFRSTEQAGTDRRYAAAIDQKSGCVLIADEKGLRAWNVENFENDWRSSLSSGPCRGLVIDEPRRRVYVVEKSTLRCLRIKD